MVKTKTHASPPRERHIWRGMAAGVIGGLAASWTMNQSQKLWGKLYGAREAAHGAQSLQQAGHGESDEQGEDAAEKTASLIVESVYDRGLPDSQKKAAGTTVHYVFGAITGGIYGALAEGFPGVAKGMGLPFGTSVWLVGDEVLIPAIGLSKPPNAYPLSKHAYSLASHLVYGLTTELVRRTMHPSGD